MNNQNNSKNTDEYQRPKRGTEAYAAEQKELTACFSKGCMGYEKQVKDAYNESNWLAEWLGNLGNSWSGSLDNGFAARIRSPRYSYLPENIFHAD